MLAKFSPASSSGLPLASTQVGLEHSDASRFGLSDHEPEVVVPRLILPSETWTPTVLPVPFTVVCAMKTLPVAGSTTWLPEIPSLFVTQLTARPVHPLASPLVFRTGAK